MKPPSSPLHFPHRDDWRRWLQEHHATSSEAWLAIRKKRADGKGLSYVEAVEQALCFGWIDGAMHSADAESYNLRFSPRQPGSIWSAANRKRAERLIEEGEMIAAGLAKVSEAKENGQWEAAFRREDTSILPDELMKALQEQAEDLAGFDSLPASRKQMLIYWVGSARTEKTRRKRIQEVVKIASMKKLSLPDF
jgi:uncharacterized protein YdeI (YjbR/CyaY-like superfamily)